MYNKNYLRILTTKFTNAMNIVNAMTGYIHSDEQGSAAERKYFRVMPLATLANDFSPSKLYFDSEDEYRAWALQYNKHEQFQK
jgi:hypothetical protein